MSSSGSVGSGGMSLMQAVLRTAASAFARVPTTASSSPPNNRNNKKGLTPPKRYVLPPDDFQRKLCELTKSVGNVRSADLCLDRSVVLGTNNMRPDVVPPQENQGQAPVTYIGVYEDTDVSIGIFVIRAGCRIPLHNHPRMHGLLKVVHGCVDVSVYTKIRPAFELEEEDGGGGGDKTKDSSSRKRLTLDDITEIPQPLKDRPHLIEKGFVFPAEKRVLRSVKEDSEPLLLTPDENNYHEIRPCGDGPAAFLDILAPPYNQDDFDVTDETRECDFFRELPFGINNGQQQQQQQQQDHPEAQQANGVNGRRTIVWLQRIPQPKEYYCDSEPYLGPRP